jgi:hypothetical protein
MYIEPQLLHHLDKRLTKEAVECLLEVALVPKLMKASG